MESAVRLGMADEEEQLPIVIITSALLKLLEAKLFSFSELGLSLDAQGDQQSILLF